MPQTRSAVGRPGKAHDEAGPFSRLALHADPAPVQIHDPVHGGGIELLRRAKIDELPSTYLKKLYYDTVTFSPYTLNMVRDMIGADRMLMGSDYPHLLGSIDRAVSSIEALNVPAVEKERIFGANALAILNNV